MLHYKHFQIWYLKYVLLVTLKFYLSDIFNAELLEMQYCYIAVEVTWVCPVCYWLIHCIAEGNIVLLLLYMLCKSLQINTYVQNL